MQRRRFLNRLLLGTAGGWLGCGAEHRRARGGRRVVALAFDGMDPQVLGDLMRRGRTPHFSRLASRGAFSSIGTSHPPQTPVAFSNIISGCDGRVHQIFDFIHRAPAPDGPLAVRPYFSTSRTDISSQVRGLSLGKWRLPLTGGEAPKLLRRGPAYWQPLVRAGHRTGVFFLPSNYPPQSAAGPGALETTSGMGTPDVLGGLGQFTLLSPDAPFRGREVNGGKFVYANLWGDNHRVEVELEGPRNFLIDPQRIEGDVPRMKARFTLVRDPHRDLVKLQVGSHQLLLNKGEWSPWIPLEFPTGIPGSAALEALQARVSLPGMARFFVKAVHPKCEIYVSPINIDPLRPVSPISRPEELSRRLGHHQGRYATLGIPEDYNALQHGALTEDEFLAQSYLAHEERVEQYRQSLSQFRDGCLFYYFGTTDLVSHMFWRDRDLDHPGRRPSESDKYATVIDDLYVHMDELVGETMEQLRDEDTLVVMSDHGFTSFRRSVNLNRLLMEWGYLVLKRNVRPESLNYFLGVDWSRTRAYAMGLNSVFVNLRGREKHGVVPPGSSQMKLVDEITSKLLDLRDEARGNTQPIVSVINVQRQWPGVDIRVAPDLLIGYAHNYRIGWDAPLGGMAEEPFADNLKRWSGDHCVAPELVPGMIMASRPFERESPQLVDIAPTLLAVCGVRVPDMMMGRPLITSQT